VPPWSISALRLPRSPRAAACGLRRRKFSWTGRLRAKQIQLDSVQIQLGCADKHCRFAFDPSLDLKMPRYLKAALLLPMESIRVPSESNGCN
jgi:hypothetical protein